MISKFLKLSTLILCVLCFFPREGYVTSAAAPQPASIRTANSKYVIQATVTEVKSEKLPAGGIDHVKLRVDSYIQGQSDIREFQLALTQSGSLVPSSGIALEKGMEVVIFLKDLRKTEGNLIHPDAIAIFASSYR